MWASLIASALLGLFAFSLINLAATASVSSWLDTGLAKMYAKNQSLLVALRWQGVSIKQFTFWLCGYVSTIVLLIWLTTGVLFFGIFAGVGGYLLALQFLHQLITNRRKRFDDQLPDLLDHLAATARAGLTLPASLREAGVYLPGPISYEILLICEYYRTSDDISTAIRRVSTEVDSRLFNLVSAALITNQQRGGDLRKVLERMSLSFREIWRLEQKIQTSAAESTKATKQLIFIALFPVALIALFNPEMLKNMTDSFSGLVVIFVATVFFLLGLWWVKRLQRVRV